MNTENWLFLVVGLIFSVPFGVAINLLTPRVQDWLEQRAITMRGKTLKRIRGEYEIVKMRHDNLERSQMVIGRQIVLTLIVLISMIIEVVFMGIGIWIFTPLFVAEIVRWQLAIAVVVFVIVLLPAGFMVANLWRYQNFVGRLTDFEKYEKNALDRIAELEGRKPEDKAAPQRKN